MSEGLLGKNQLPKQKHNNGGHHPNRNNHSGVSIGQYLLPTVLIAGLVFLLRIATTTPISSDLVAIPGEDILEMVVGYAVLVCELFAVAVIAITAVQALAQYLRTNFKRKPIACQISDSESNRLSMGHRLSLALEFAVAADILRLAISPSFYHLLFLFAIILLRILLNYFLEYDSQTIRERHYVQELEEAEEGEILELDSEDCCG
jgi:uncharacterized membrane protein